MGGNSGICPSLRGSGDYNRQPTFPADVSRFIMTTQACAALRYPKGWFALTTVYSFTGLAILASIVFSLLLFLSIDENPLMKCNAVHLSGAALRFTGKRVFDIFTALGLDGLGRFSMNMTPMQPRNSANLRGVWAGDNAPAITAIWFAMN